MGFERAAAGEGELPSRLVSDWFERFHGGLFRYLTRLTGDAERAADLLQETFERALKALQRAAPPENEAAWLYRIASNLAYDDLRRRRRMRWLPLRGDEEAPAFEGALAEAQLVRECLAALRPQEAEALLLYEYAGLSCVEIGALLDEPPATVRVRVYRARKSFRKRYDRE
ncbi:MAG TPA: RNA polymerase sigma factor [Chloroflexaceae bacterium]|nr:RNA polymerase sigma factor [Chloroflexaceae bacterium]